VEASETKVKELMDLLEQSRAQFNIYIPKKEDNIDCSLAKVINNYPEKDKMKILFLRESEGVYQFGQRRVGIKVEKGDTPLVRVGGGYMDVENFINNFTESELIKMERKDVIGRFKNKLQAQRIAHQRSVSYYETKAIGTSNVTPRLVKRSVSRQVHSRNASMNPV